MKGKLVNEKTLELNITHEGLDIAGFGVFGFTQPQESKIGGDVLFAFPTPFILQYKAAKSGVDGTNARFRINNNKLNNQHQALDAIARSRICGAYYMFPLIISDNFLTTNFNNLLNFTCMVDASLLTGNLNWVNQAHSVIIDQNCQFVAKSEGEVEGEGFPAKSFFKELMEQYGKEIREEQPSEYVKNLIGRLNEVVKEAQVYGESEHTLLILGSDVSRKEMGYIQLPIRLKGLKGRKKEPFTLDDF